LFLLSLAWCSRCARWRGACGLQMMKITRLTPLGLTRLADEVWIYRPDRRFFLGGAWSGGGLG
jgi:hypothetical protein